MTSTFREATEADAAELAALHNAVAEDLTARYGKGHWSYHGTERGVLYELKIGRVFVQTDATGHHRDVQAGHTQAVGDRHVLLHAGERGLCTCRAWRCGRSCSARASGVG